MHISRQTIMKKMHEMCNKSVCQKSDVHKIRQKNFMHEIVLKHFIHILSNSHAHAAKRQYVFPETQYKT